MGEPVGPTTPALSLPLPLLSKKALEASSRTEALVLLLASGILFLASLVCLLVWVLRRAAPPRSAAGKNKEKEQRRVSIVLPAETGTSSSATDDDAREDGANANANATGTGTGNGNNYVEDEPPLRVHRRRSTWGGRPAHADSRPGGRRRSAGSRRKAYNIDDDDRDEGEGEEKGAQTSVSSPGPEPEPEAGHVALTALGGMGRMAAALVIPATMPLLLGADEGEGSGSGGGEGAEDKEPGEIDARRAWGDAGPVATSIEKPGSPRSPRVLAADQAAMLDALWSEGGEERIWKAGVPSPVSGGAEGAPPALASGFDDPLGVNKLVALPGGDDGEGPEGVEMESRDGVS